MSTPHPIGHNGGPTMEPGAGWRRHAWKQARAQLLPQLPLPVIQRRLRRANQLGLPYATYAAAHQAAGRDIVALLFSNNALRLIRTGDRLPPTRAEKLQRLADCGTALLAHPPQDPATLAARIAADHQIALSPAAPAPTLRQSWGETRAALRTLLHAAGHPPGAVMLICDTALEAAWAPTASLAGHLPAARYFSA